MVNPIPTPADGVTSAPAQAVPPGPNSASRRSTSRLRKRKEALKSTPLKVFATWAVVLVLTAASLAALALHLRLLYSDPALFRVLVINHVQALIGIPLAAASAFCIL